MDKKEEECREALTKQIDKSKCDIIDQVMMIVAEQLNHHREVGSVLENLAAEVEAQRNLVSPHSLFAFSRLSRTLPIPAGAGPLKSLVFFLASTSRLGFNFCHLVVSTPADIFSLGSSTKSPSSPSKRRPK